MNHAPVVRELQRLEDLRRSGDHQGQIAACGAAHIGRDLRTVDQLRSNERGSAVAPDLVDARDAGVHQSHRRLELPLQPRVHFAAADIIQQTELQNLQGYRPAGHRVPSPVDCTENTAADLVEQRVSGELSHRFRLA